MSVHVSDKGFFSRENLHRAVWTLIGVAITAAVGLAYRGFKGPDEVKVVTKDDNPLLVKVANPNSVSPSASDVEALVRAIDRLAKANARAVPAKQQQPLIDSVISAGARVQSRGADYAVSAQPEPAISPTALPAPTSTNVNQYMEARLRDKGVRETKCPAAQAVSGTPLSLAFSVPANWRIADATDATFSVARVNSSTSLTEVFDAAQSIRPGLDSVSFDRPLPAGLYRLEYGFFMKSELAQETPKFYAISCNVALSAAN